MTVTRRDALVCELDTAIRLWFFEYDPLSIHLIVVAAHTCLDDLGKKDGKGPVARKQVGAAQLTTVYDWLRHASSDPHDVVDFPPLSNALLLWDAVISFRKIFGGSTASMRTYLAFFALRIRPTLKPPNPHLSEHSDAFLPEGVTVEDVGNLSRLEFFAKLTEMFAAEILRHQR